MPYEYFAQVIRVLDGDTIEVSLDLGFDVHLGPRTLRLYGLNAPEIHDQDPKIKARAEAAKAFIEARLLPPEVAIKIQTRKPDSTDKYGRVLGTVFYQVVAPAPKKGKKKPEPPAWVNLNDELIAAGHAKPYFGEGEKPV